MARKFLLVLWAVLVVEEIESVQWDGIRPWFSGSRKLNQTRSFGGRLELPDDGANPMIISEQ